MKVPEWALGAAGGVLLLGAVGAGAAVATAAGGNGDDDEPLTGDTYDRAVEAALEHTGGGEVLETEAGDDGAAYEVEVRLPDGRVVEVHLDDGFQVVGDEDDDDGTGDDRDEPLTGDTYDRAVQAALAHTGGGEPGETELGDGMDAYEVEIRLPDGRRVEVKLDEDFQVIGQEGDDDDNDDNPDDDGPDDD